MSKKQPEIEIICILDRSGSMWTLQEEVIGAFNNFIETQKKEPGKANVTLVLFDDQYEVVYQNKKLSKVPELTSKTYFTRGMTGMYDAIGKAINSSESKDAMVLIQTDGQENSSKEYTGDQIKKLIEDKEKIGWDFIFLGADINTASEAHKFGMDTNKSFNYNKSAQGINIAFNAMSSATSNYRMSKTDEHSLNNKQGK